ncbi:SPOR domain-containing protein [Rhodobacter sp. NSM]|uniref:SPOR domain-containing protein n=1 Tax=Rhodobacter sp. NSM TaxID=3457501 RepID=UPI003FD601C0
MLFRAITFAIWCSVAGGGMAIAQDGPAERPPESFRGPQYVDSKGCVYLRAGFGGTVNWVPRVTRDRQPLCGYPPSFAATPAPAEPVAAGVEAAPVTAVAPAETEAEVAAPASVSVQPAIEATRTRTVLKHRRSHQRIARVVVRADTAAEAEALRRLTLHRDEIRAAADLPSGVTCPPSAPQLRRFATSEGGSTLLCARAGQGLQGVRVPVLDPADGVARLSAAGSGRPEAAAGRYVQIGAYLRQGNAGRARQRLADLGLPVSVAEGGALEIILAGPFDDRTTTLDALRNLRGAGYRDAFIR